MSGLETHKFYCAGHDRRASIRSREVQNDRSPNSIIRSVIALLVMYASIFSATGCSRHNSASNHTLPVSERFLRPAGSPAAAPGNSSAGLAESAITHVRSLPRYKDAQQACASKHYSEAAELLLSLSRTSGLNKNEIAFCVSQFNVCRKDSGLPLRSSDRDRDRDSINDRHEVSSNTRRLSPNTASEADCGPKALAIACQQFNTRTILADLRKAAGTTKDGTTMGGPGDSRTDPGLKAEGIQVGRDALSHLQMPAIAWFHGNHFVAVLALNGGAGDAGTAEIHDPNDPRPEKVSVRRFYFETVRAIYCG